MPDVALKQGTIAYEDRGSGPPVVFIHGAFVDGRLWADVVPLLERDMRCIVPTLPLGAHARAMNPDADVSPGGVAELVADFIEALNLEDVTLVGNDTGGAICQLVVTRRPGRIGRLVLTNCDAFENFLPLAFRYLQVVPRIPGGITVLANSMRLRAVRQLPVAFGWLTSKPVDRARSDGWVAPIISDKAVRRDTAKLLRGIDKRLTLEAAEKLRGFDKPALLVWGTADRFFKVGFADRLAATMPNCRVERIEGARTFVMIDEPRRVADAIAAFVREPSAQAAQAPA